MQEGKLGEKGSTKEGIFRTAFRTPSSLIPLTKLIWGIRMQYQATSDVDLA